MAEWFKRGTVNTFNRGSNPLKAYKLEILFFNFLTKINLDIILRLFVFLIPFKIKNKKGKFILKEYYIQY